MTTPSSTSSMLEPIAVGITISSRISTLRGSPTVSFSQPLLLSKIIAPAGLLISAEILLLLVKYILKRDSIGVLDQTGNQIIQMPLSELQAFLEQIHTGRQAGNASAIPSTNTGSMGPIFPTPQPIEAPLLISLFIAADYNTENYTPSTWLFIPMLSFPELRGALPLLILDLLATIFVRCVVPPETTGAKPIPKLSKVSDTQFNLNQDDLIKMLQRFGKYFSKE